MSTFLGHFHPLLVHLPIGILLIALLLQWLARREKYKVFQPAVGVVLLCGAFTALCSCITGYLLSTTDDYDATIVGWHFWMAIALTVTSFTLYAKEKNPQFAVPKNVLSVSLLALIMITGHLGGSLTHGSDYLTKPLTAILSGDTATPLVIKPLVNVQEAQVYADVVKPVLAAKCYSCHGATKQKGGLRMDDSLRLMKGGKDGVVIKIGDADKSELIKRIALALNDDDHMPPKEKPQLSKGQIALLHWWIENGAAFNKKVIEIPQTPAVKQELLALQAPQKAHPETSAVPAEAVVKGDDKAITKLKDAGAMVLPVAQGNNYLLVSFITDTIVSIKALENMQQLSKQLIWLKLAGTNIGDAALQYVGKLSNLTRLDISNTAITDAGVQWLTALPHLQYLNLVGTKVTVKGVAQLKNNKALTGLFLYKTGVGTSDFAKLKVMFPHTNIDTGGYAVPTLPTDTTEVKMKKNY